MKIDRAWWWLVPLSLLWPVVHGLVFLLRFGSLPPDPMLLLTFIPMSFTSGTVFLAFWVRAKIPAKKSILVLGYVLASPIALVGSLLSGLFDQEMMMTMLWGAGPLMVGTLIGGVLGYILPKFTQPFDKDRAGHPVDNRKDEIQE